MKSYELTLTRNYDTDDANRRADFSDHTKYLKLSATSASAGPVFRRRLASPPSRGVHRVEESTAPT